MENKEGDKKATMEVRILSSKSLKYSRNGDVKCISCIQFYYILFIGWPLSFHKYELCQLPTTTWLF